MNAPVQQPLQAPPVAPPLAKVKKKPNAALIIVVIVVVIVLLITAVALAGGGNTKANNSGSVNTDNDGSTTPTNNGNTDTTDTTSTATNSNSQITMSVSDVQAHHSTDMFDQAADGNILVIVYANITNNGVLPMYVSPLDFFLICSDGNSYSYSWKLDSFSSAELDHGKSMAIYCAFEIPQGITPKTLKYDDSTDSISVAISSSIIDLTYPQYVSITGASYAVVDSGNPYLTPSAGNEFVQVTMTFKSNMPTTLTMSTYDFTLETSDGQTHHITYYVDPVIPDGLQYGASTTLKLTFEVSQSSMPTKLVYDDAVNNIIIDL